MPELTPLAQGVFAWLQEPARLGVPNAGVVLDGDGATVIDTLTVPSQFGPFGDAVDALGFPVRRIVLTGDHIEFVGGTVRFRNGGRLRLAVPTSAHLDQPPNPAVYRALFPDLAAEFDDEMQTRPVTPRRGRGDAAHAGGVSPSRCRGQSADEPRGARARVRRRCSPAPCAASA